MYILVAALCTYALGYRFYSAFLAARALALPVIAYLARLTRGSLLEVLRAPWIRAARARGLPNDQVVAARYILCTLLDEMPKLDDLALMEALKSPSFYVGALGSRKTNDSRRKRLENKIFQKRLRRHRYKISWWPKVLCWWDLSRI